VNCVTDCVLPQSVEIFLQFAPHCINVDTVVRSNEFMIARFIIASIQNGRL
jgi:hypothetical protein